MRVTNKMVREMVAAKRPFVAPTMRGFLHNTNLYVVYSYLKPILICEVGQDKWYENTDKFSTTTSRHLSQARPATKTEPLNTRQMEAMVSGEAEM